MSEVIMLLKLKRIKNVDAHVKQCNKCKQWNLSLQHYEQLQVEGPSMLIYFIAMDFIGNFKVTAQGHQYALTVIDVLTNYACCLPLFTKEADKVMHAYLVNMYSMFGGLHKILSDKDTKFFMEIDSTLGMKQVFSSPYYPHSNVHIENIHNFLKTCIERMSPLNFHGMKWFI